MQGEPHVPPRPAEPPRVDGDVNRALRLAFVIAAPAWLVVAYVSAAAGVAHEIAEGLASSLAIGCFVFAFQYLNETRRLSHRLRLLLQTSTQLAQDALQFLDAASQSVESAVHEFEQRSFGPFWDSVEAARETLGRFQQVRSRLSNAAREYTVALQGRTHTFPPFPINVRDLPDPSPILERLDATVQLAQRDFEFSNILEHREERKLLARGFLALARGTKEVVSFVKAQHEELHKYAAADEKIGKEQTELLQNILDKVK